MSSSVTYIDLETAAKRSGRSAGHLSRLCREQLAAKGLAKLVKPTTGGKATWHVAETADPAFAAVKFPEQITIDMRVYTAEQRAEAERRRKILDGWEQHIQAAAKLGYGRVAATNRYLERLLIEANTTVSVGTLYLWYKAFRTGGLPGLVDGRGKTEVAPAAGPDPFLAEVQRLYLSLRRPKLTTCVAMAEITAAEQGWEVRTYKTCQRHVDKLPAGLVTKMRMGEDAYVAKAQTYIERDYTTLASNDAWCADHHQMDVIVNSGGKLIRPWLSVWQDIRSRKIVGWVIVDHDPNTDTILAAWRAAVVAHGVPKAIYVDNGKDYDSKALNGRTKRERWVSSKIKVKLDPGRADGLFPQLGVAINHVWPYHGQSKPVERWFQGPCEANRTWATYCGNTTAAKPEDLQLQLERGKAPKFADYVAWFADWLDAHDAGHKHSGDGMDGMTPNQVFAANLHTKRTAPADLLDLLCLTRVGPLKVGRNGVTWKGLRYGQHESALQRMLGDEVILRIDERDVTSVQVYDLKDRLICVAPTNDKIAWGADAQDLRDAIRAKKQDRKLLNTYVDRRPRIADDLPERLLQAAAAKAAKARAESDPSPPPNLQPIQHPLAAQLDAVQTAVEAASTRRQAVGSESLPLPSRFLYSPTDDAEPATYTAPMSFRELMSGQEGSSND